MIDRSTVDKVMDAANIVEVVSEFVTLKKRGVNYVGLCPFHDDKTPSFYVSPAKNLCKCFACGKGGNTVHFIMEHEQMTFPEAIRWLAKKYHIEIEEKELTAEEVAQQNTRESLFVVNEFAKEYFQQILYNHVAGRSIGMAYFHQRGIRDDIIRKFQLGYSTDSSDALAKEASQKGYKREYLVKTGLCLEKENGTLRDRFWGRVIYPWHTVTGKVVAFSGRVLQSNAKTAKYVNSPESEIYQKRKELYGIYFAKQAIIKQDKCFLVEGQMDVISMHQSGIENVVANSGTALTQEQIKLLHRFTNNITLLYDGDSAGIHASLRGIDMLLSEGMNIKVLLLPNGEDPDSFSRSHNAAEFRQFIAEREEDFIRFKTRLLLDEAENDPIKRAQLVANIAQSIGQIPNKIVRFTYTQECATLLHISEKIILEECEKYVKKRRQAFFNSSLEEKTSALPVDDAPPINVPTEECPPTPLSKAAKDAGDYQTYIPEIEREKLLFYTQEVELIKSIVRYGELPLYKIRSDDGQSRDLSVIEYIANDLKQDDLQFHHPLHRKIVAEGLAHLHDEGFTCERYFLTHPDQRISRIAAELISERYELSRRYEMNTEKDRLVHIIPQNLINFKLSIIEEEMKHTALLLSNPGPMKDGSRTKEIMLRYKELSTLMAKIAEKAGRVVI